MVEGGMKNGKTALLTVAQDPFHNWSRGTFVIFAQQIPGLWQNSQITHSKSARQTVSNLTYSEALLIFCSYWKPRMYSSWSSHFAKSWRERMFMVIVLPKEKKLQSLRKAEWRSWDMTSLCELRDVIQFIQSPPVNIKHWILTWVHTFWNDKNGANCYFLFRKIPQSWQMHCYHKQSQGRDILSHASHKLDHLNKIYCQQCVTVSPFANFHCI